MAKMEKRVTDDARRLLEDFTSALSVDWEGPAELLDAAQEAIEGCRGWRMYEHAERERRLFAIVNSQLRLNKVRFQEFLDAVAMEGVSLNYHDKAEVLRHLNGGEGAEFNRWLRGCPNYRKFSGLFRPLSRHETKAALHEQLRTGAVSRKDAKKIAVAERRDQVLRSLYGSYAFSSFPAEAMHRHFNPDCRMKYFADFYQHLLQFYPRVLGRDCALIYLNVDERLREGLSSEQLREALYNFIRDAYERLANHCFLAILVKPFHEGDEDGQWRLFSDLILYGEKHREIPLEIGYFHPTEVEKKTSSHIPNINLEAARFEIANEGFFFRDCFVLAPKTASGQLQTTSEDVDLLLLFEKNERDETLIPCPGCRSMNVAGNSYPSLGVRSWECQNPVCPERSAFDRGKRYSLSALIKQEAIKSDKDQIPEFSLKKWKLDVVPDVDEQGVSEMLLRHFSLHGDQVLFVNCMMRQRQSHGRRVQYEDFRPSLRAHSLHEQFQKSPYFARFVVDRDVPITTSAYKASSPTSEVQVFQGDCFEVLSEMPEASIDGAVTSPPYYNARSYSEWPNIYCYLYDIYNSARQVFRVLKPGSLYLFNVFDYFDNENNLVFSAMGKKRMILGAYVVNLFRRVGFEIRGNVVWAKGEIEGKRNFNQGNRSPYYQFPFNCWEHVLVFRKPGAVSRIYHLPKILAARPVVKMVRGQNVLGHSAPFPPSIPNLLISGMRRGECVLDPFSGSMTTGRAAFSHGLRSVSIEMHREYCELGLRLLAEDIRNSPALFARLEPDEFETARTHAAAK
jgi:DNA modification methylase